MHKEKVKPLFTIKCYKFGKIQEIDKTDNLMKAENLYNKYRYTTGYSKIWISLENNTVRTKF